MAVTPNGRAFAVLRELNKGLPQGQKITNAAFDRQTADLKREDVAQCGAGASGTPRRRPAQGEGGRRNRSGSSRIAPPDGAGAKFHGPCEPASANGRAMRETASAGGRAPRTVRGRGRHGSGNGCSVASLRTRDVLHLAHERTRELWANRELGNPSTGDGGRRAPRCAPSRSGRGKPGSRGGYTG
jgi:hypothetical protein